MIDCTRAFSGAFICISTGYSNYLYILSCTELLNLNSLTFKEFVITIYTRYQFNIQVKRLLSEDYVAGLRSIIRPDKSLPGNMLSGEIQQLPEGANTTQFSMIDGVRAVRLLGIYAV